MKTVSFQAKDKKLSQGGAGLPIPKNASQIQMPGGPDSTDRTEAELLATPLRDPTAVDEQFPTAAHIDSKPGDALLAAKVDLAAKTAEAVPGGLPGVTPFGVLQAKDSDFQRLIDIREKELNVQFERWFAVNFDKMDVTHKAAARELFGKFYEDRLKNLDTNIELTRKIARLKVTGPQTKEDLYLLYALEAGLIDTAYLDNLLHPERAISKQKEEVRQARFRRGLFNPKRFVRGDNGGFNRGDVAKEAVGRNFDIPAASFGVNGTAFSVVGDVDESEEIMNTNFEKTLDMINK